MKTTNFNSEVQQLMSTSTTNNSVVNDMVLETAPSPGRIAVAIAGYPYSPKAAILDLIDNSVEAAADSIAVLIDQGGKDLRSLAIVDNGTGISEDILDEVLRAGSRTAHLYGEQSLSRYGVGLKGAGFSLGARITVLTRSNGTLNRRSIDLNRIQETDRWIQEVRPPNEQEKTLFDLARNRLSTKDSTGSGTLVLIENPNIRSRDLTRFKNDIVRGIGQTYAKFLGSSSGSAKIGVRVVENWRDKPAYKDIEPIDPLHRENPSTTVLFNREEITFDDGSAIFFSAVALPHPSAVPPELKREYRYMQSDQGIYVYRNGRLLLGGETLGLFGRDFHLNAFRAEVEYTTTADERILVDVAKSSVILAPDASSRLQELVNICTKTADTLWRERDVLKPEDIKEVFQETNRLIESRHRLLVDIARKRKIQREKESTTTTTTEKSTNTAAKKVEKKPVTPEKPEKRETASYLVPRDSLPEDVLYRPIFHPDLKTVVVEVNLSHPFSKAIFAISASEGKGTLPRKATTAAQQLLFVLGDVEHSLNDDDMNRELFNQFRRYASMNLRALLAD